MQNFGCMKPITPLEHSIFLDMFDHRQTSPTTEDRIILFTVPL
jgi:hypothetical protein